MTSEVGSGQVAIFPIFKGFKSAISSQVSNATSAAGRAAGTGFTKAFSSGAGNVGADSAKKLSSNVASASAALSKARLSEQDAAGKVRVAEVALAEARAKGGEGSARAVAAEERLASAQRKLTEATGKTKTASTSLATAQGKLKEATETTGSTSEKAASKYSKGWAGVKEQISGTLTKAVKDAGEDAAKEAQGSGSKAASKFSSGVKSALGGIAKVGALAAGAVAAVGGVIVGLSIKGGLARQLQIEEAEAKLDGLGHSTKAITVIMDNAMASVKGTAYGMGEAATVAAGATAAGIKPGKELERILKLTGDAATIAGTDLSGMGNIFNKVAANNKLSGMEVLQLQKQGFPILNMVAKQYGVTQEEASKMVSQGKIDFKTFADAIEANVGGAALSSGGTTQGALANMKASFSRFGVVLTSWFLPLMKNVFNAVGQAMDGLTYVLKPFSEAFGKIFRDKMGPIIEAFGNGAVKFFESVGNSANGLGGKIIPIFTSVKDALSQLHAGFTLPRENAQALAGDLDGFVLVGERVRASLREVAGGVRAFGAAFSEGGTDITSSGFAGILEMLGLVARNIWDAFGPVIKNLGPGLLQLVQSFSPLGIILSALAPVLPALAIAAAQLATALSGALGAAVSALAPIIEGILTTAAGLISGFMDMQGGSDALAAAIGVVVAGFAAYKLVIAGIVAYQAIMKGVTLATKLWAMGQAALNIVLNMNPIGLIIIAIAALVAGIVLLVKNWDKVVGFLKGAWQGFVDWFQGIMAGFLGWWDGVWQSVIGFVQPIWDKIVAVVQLAWSLIVGAVRTYIGMVLTIIQTVWAVIQTVFTTAWEVIKTIVATALAILISIFTGRFDQIGALLASAWEKISGLFSGALGKIGGIVSDGWAKLVEIFTGAMDKVKAFLAAGWQSISDTAMSVWNSIVAWFKGIPDRIISAIVALALLYIRMGEWFGSVKDAAIQKLVDLVGWVQGLPGRILSALGNVGTLLWDAGSNILQGFLNGLKAGFKGVQDFVGGIGEWIAANKGPEAYDKALLVPAGGWIMGGLTKSLKAQIPKLKDVLGDVSAVIRTGVEGPDALGLGTDGAAAMTGRQAPNEAQTPPEERAIERIVLDVGGEQVFARIVRKGERKLVRA